MTIRSLSSRISQAAAPTHDSATVQSSSVKSITASRASRRPTLRARATFASGSTTSRAPKRSATSATALSPLWSTTITSAGRGSQRSSERRHWESSSRRPTVGITTETGAVPLTGAAAPA